MINVAAETSFQNCAETVAHFIAGAKQSLRIAVCWFTHPPLYRLLLERLKEGVQLEIIVNFDQINFHPEGLNFKLLEKGGAKIYGFCGPGLLHHKFAVADGLQVLTGSFNWTRSEHFDHLLILSCPKTANAFSQAFETLLPRCDALAVLREKPVRHLSFQQLHCPTLWSALDLRKSIVAGGKVWIVAFGRKEATLWHRCFSEQKHFFRCGSPIHSFWQNHPVWEEQAFHHWQAEQLNPARFKAVATYCLRVKPGAVFIAIEPFKRILGIGLVSSPPEACELPQYGISRYVPWLRWPDGVSVPDPAILASRQALRRYSGSGLRVVEVLMS